MMIEILSPHIDDATFSLGCYILQQNSKRVSFEVTNCFSISNYHLGGEKLNEEEVTLMRKKEDALFRQLLAKRVKFNYLDFYDAPIRGHTQLTYKDKLTERDLYEISLLHNYLKKKTSNRFIAPLGLGSHIDHIICHLAACDLRADRLFGFYEDLPYTGRLGEKEILKRIKVVERCIGFKLKPIIVGGEFIHSKEEICNLYTSQMKVWYLEKILAELSKQQGERLWLLDNPEH